MSALLFLRREIHSDVRARNNQSTNHLRMISRQDESKIGTVTVSYDVNDAEAELLDDSRRIIRHHLVGERPGAIRTMPIPPLIDADDGSIGRKIVPLVPEAVVKEGHPTV